MSRQRESRVWTIAAGPALPAKYRGAVVATLLVLAASITSLPPGPRLPATRLVAAPGTPGTASADPVIATAGDIACDPATRAFNGGFGTSSQCRQRAVSDLLIHTGLAAVLPLGDEQYERGRLVAFNRAYDASWGRVLSITRPTPGNHEYETAGATGYYSYFGSRAGSPARGYYSYDIGRWHVIALNAECPHVGCSSGSAQERWLAADLAAHPRNCTLAYWHQPRFSSGRHGSDRRYDAFWRDLYKAGADVVLNGHDHDYERFAPQTPSGSTDAARGLREFVVGTGGRSHYPAHQAVANSQVRNSDTFGVLRLTLHPTGYDWTFVPAAGRSFRDSGSDSCH